MYMYKSVLTLYQVIKVEVHVHVHININLISCDKVRGNMYMYVSLLTLYHVIKLEVTCTCMCHY